MSHYRKITVDGVEYEYCVGRHRTQIRQLGADGKAVKTLGVYSNGDEIGKTIDEDTTSVRPRDVESRIRNDLGLPRREYDWDTPVNAKSDPGPKTRGFRHLIGAKIIDVRVSAINEVILEADDGARYAIESQETHYGIGVISLRVLGGTESED